MSFITVDSVTKKFEVKDRNVKGLNRIFGKNTTDFVAVDNISFTVNKGEALGFIGPNGAGKSTTIKMLTGILTPTTGKIDVDGLALYKHRKQYLRNIGVVFGQRSQLWWDLPVEESYKLLKRVYKVSNTDYINNINKFHDLLNLGDLLKKPVRQLSLGQRMRCEIAASFLHNPKLVFLDEPTIGLDIIAKENIRYFIKTLNKENKVTIMLTSHDLTDIQNICQRLIVIDKGKIVHEGSVESISDLYGKRRNVSLELSDNIIIDNPYITIEKDDGLTKVISFELDEISMKKVIEYISNRTDIIDMKVSGTPIDHVIKNIYTMGHS